MPRHSSGEILRGILIVINECLVILGRPRLSNGQSAVILGVLAGMARRPSPLQRSFQDELLRIVGMENQEQKRAELLKLLGRQVA